MKSPPPSEVEFRAVLEAHGGILARVARSYAAGDADVAELRQEMTYELWNALPRFAGQAKVSTWIYRVCLNTALTWRRGTDRRERRMEPRAELGEHAASEATPAERADRTDLLARLYEALHDLKPVERALVLLSLDGVSYREMAEVTGLTENHVGVALLRARKQLAEKMKGVIDELA